jgi:RNAse (barnase) inhibitor barstar
MSETGMAEAKGEDLDALIEAAAKALRVPIESAWKHAIDANLKVSLRLAAIVEEFDLADEAEPAPVFEA